MLVTAYARADHSLPQHMSQSGASCPVLEAGTWAYCSQAARQPMLLAACARTDQPAYASAALCPCRTMRHPCYPERTKEVSPTCPGLVPNRLPPRNRTSCWSQQLQTAVSVADPLSQTLPGVQVHAKARHSWQRKLPGCHNTSCLGDTECDWAHPELQASARALHFPKALVSQASTQTLQARHHQERRNPPIRCPVDVTTRISEEEQNSFTMHFQDILQRPPSVQCYIGNQYGGKGTLAGSAGPAASLLCRCMFGACAESTQARARLAMKCTAPRLGMSAGSLTSSVLSLPSSMEGGFA